MSTLFETYENSKGETLNIYYDEFCESPREDCENIGTLILKNGINETNFDYNYDCPQVFESEQDAIETIPKHIKKYFGEDFVAICPIFKYEHSGVQYSLNPFGCKWDSGLAGFMVVFSKDARKLLDVKRLSVQKKVQALEYAYGEFKVSKEVPKANGLREGGRDKDGYENGWSGGCYGTDINTNVILDYAQGFNEVVNSEREKLVA